jgi:mannosyltransferase
LRAAPPDEKTDGPLARPSRHAPPRRTRAARLALLVPAVLMLCVGLVGLDRGSMWRDEAASLVASQRSLPELWAMLGRVETVHAVYYTLLHAWLQLGTGVVWARVPSVVAMAVAAGLVTLLGARLASAQVGVVAGLLFVANPSVSYYAQEARSTALVVALALLSTWFLLRAVGRRPRWWLAYAGAAVVLVGLNLLAFLVVLAHAVTLLAWRGPRRDLRRWAVAAGPALLVSIALVVVTGRQPFQIGWIPRPGTASLRELAHLTLGPNAVLVVLGALLVLLGSLPGRAPSRRRLQAYAVPLLVLPAAVLLTVSLVQPVFVPRYVFPSVAAAALLAALGVERVAHLLAARLPRRAVATAPATAPVLVSLLVSGLAVLVVAGAGFGAQRYERTPASRSDDLAGTAGVVAAAARPGDGVLFLPDNRRLVALAYPQAFVGVHDITLAQGPDEAANLTGRQLPLAESLGNLEHSPRVWVVGRPGLALLPSEAESRTELALLDRDFVRLDTVSPHGVGIALYIRRPASS